MQSVYNAASNFKLHEKLFNWLIRTYRNDRNQCTNTKYHCSLTNNRKRRSNLTFLKVAVRNGQPLLGLAVKELHQYGREL